jgi:hypothetical protein
MMARHLGTEPQGDALVWLDPQDQGVCLLSLHLRCADRQMWRPLELEDHLGHPGRQALAAADVERESFQANLTARGHRPTAAVRVAQLGQDAGLIGAADLARR